MSPFSASPSTRYRVGVDFVEVSSHYDASEITSLLAARTSIDFIGSIFHERATRRA
jgi:agmatinase